MKTIDGKTYIETNVVMVATDTYTGIVNHSTGLDKIFHTKESAEKAVLDIGGTHQQLYFTTDEKKALNDWVYSTVTNEVYFVKEYNSKTGIARDEDGFAFMLDSCKKIIATTDPKLMADGVAEIEQSFIEEYCKAGGIDKVLVEYQGDWWEDQTRTEIPISGQMGVRPKLTPDNTINIRPVKEKMYSREEAVENVYDFLAERLGLKELETLRNIWVNSEGQKFKLTAYGFKWIE